MKKFIVDNMHIFVVLALALSIYACYKHCKHCYGREGKRQNIKEKNSQKQETVSQTESEEKTETIN